MSPLDSDNFYERLVEFDKKVKKAKLMGINYVETTKEVIEHYNPKGLNGAAYFWFEQVRVSEEGTMDEILSKEKESNVAHVPGHPGAVFEGVV